MVDLTKTPELTDLESPSPPPLPIEFTVRHREGADWVPGDGFERRDLGLSEASNGLLDASHYRGLRNGSVLDRDQVPGDLDVFYVFAGNLSISRDDETTELLQPGDCIHHGPGGARRIVAVSGDCELLRIRSQARFRSGPGRTIPQGHDSTGPLGRANCRILANTPESYVVGAGPRSYFGYRDLGADEATNGQIHLHMIRATAAEAPATGTGWHVHSMSQWYIVTRGVGNIDVAKHSRHRLVRGDCMTISAYMPHDEFRFSSEYELIQLCTPARYETLAVAAP